MESDHAVRAALARYDEPLLRTIAARLFKPRSHWPADELIERAVESLGNLPVIDRRLKDLSPASRALLAAIGLSRRPVWSVGPLLELLAVLGHAEGLTPVLAVLDAGLAVPVLPPDAAPLHAWEDWLGAAPTAARLHVPSAVAERAARDGVGLPALPSKRFEPKALHRADGLDWPLRLGVLWQQLRSAPVRLTIANALFKRDQSRLQEDSLLAAPLVEHHVDVPDAGPLVMHVGIASGLLLADAGELRAGQFSAAWDAGLTATSAELWQAQSGVTNWDPVHGCRSRETPEPFPTVALAATLLLAGQPDGDWTHPADVAQHIATRHPSWTATLDGHEADDWIEALFLGWALPLGLLEAAQDGEGWWFRLTTLGRHLLAGGPAPDTTNPFPRCLVVQPNADVIAYRHGLTPGLIAKLSRFADWKTLGPACTLGLSADSVYRGLEAGLTLGDIVALLQQHSGHPVPANVVDLIRRWAGKRERIAVHASATLLEFTSDADLEAAFARGLIVQKLTDRIGLANGEIDYKQLRLLGNRDYEARPQQCVRFDPDGVTFTVDVAAADLMLEAELQRLAEPLNGHGAERRFQITPATAQQWRDAGLALADVEQWSLSRSGTALSASARLLFNGSAGAAGELHQRLVLTLPSAELTDGICQWPATADLLVERLGPVAVAVAEEDLDELLKRLALIGVAVSRPT